MNHEDVPKKELHWVHLVHLFVVPPSHKWSRSSAIVGCHQKASKRTCLVQINSTTLQPIHTQQKKNKVHETVNEVRWWFQVHIFCYMWPKNSQLHWEILIRRPWKNQQTNHWQKMQQKLRASSVSFLRLKNMMQSPARLPFQWRPKAGDIVFNTMETIHTSQQKGNHLRNMISKAHLVLHQKHPTSTFWFTCV